MANQSNNELNFNILSSNSDILAKSACATIVTTVWWTVVQSKMKSFKHILQFLMIVWLIFFIGCGGNQKDISVKESKDEKPSVQMQVQQTLEVLDEIKSNSTKEPSDEVKTLIDALKDEDEYVRMEAAESLGKIIIKDKQAVKQAEESLISAFKEVDAYTRREAVKVLSEIKDRQVVEPLIIALKKEDINLQEIERKNLQEIKMKTIENVRIKNGINYIDINEDGKKDMVVKGYRGNISAHSFSVYSFYVYKEHVYIQDYKEQIWNIVARQDSEDISKESYITYTHEGADGILRDIRLVKLKDKKGYYLVIAERPIGENYASEENVIFSFYKLFYDPDERRFTYRKVKEIKAGNKYCDVNTAFETELGYK